MNYRKLCKRLIQLLRAEREDLKAAREALKAERANAAAASYDAAFYQAKFKQIREELDYLLTRLRYF